MTATFPCVTSTPLPSHSEIQVSSTVPAQVLSVATTTDLAPSSLLHSSRDVLSSKFPSSMSILVPSGSSGSESGNNGKIALVSGIVVFLVITMASALGIALAIVFLLRRRKTTRMDPKGQDLSNPNNESSEFWNSRGKMV